jgi:guanylate kinase
MAQKEFAEELGFSTSHTTRGPRPGEEDGREYHFSTREKMQPMIDAGEFVESCEVHGNLYGTSAAAVRQVTEDGKICILDIDVQGAKKVKANKTANLDCRYVFIAPPSFEALEARLRGRGTEDEDKMQIRLKNARAEVEFSKEKGFWDRVIVNDNLENAYAEFKEFVLGK